MNLPERPWTSIGWICAILALILIVIAWAGGSVTLLLVPILLLLAVSRLL